MKATELILTLIVFYGIGTVLGLKCYHCGGQCGKIINGKELKCPRRCFTDPYVLLDCPNNDDICVKHYGEDRWEGYRIHIESRGCAKRSEANGQMGCHSNTGVGFQGCFCDTDECNDKTTECAHLNCEDCKNWPSDFYEDEFTLVFECPRIAPTGMKNVCMKKLDPDRRVAIRGCSLISKTSSIKDKLECTKDSNGDYTCLCDDHKECNLQKLDAMSCLQSNRIFDSCGAVEIPEDKNNYICQFSFAPNENLHQTYGCLPRTPENNINEEYKCTCEEIGVDHIRCECICGTPECNDYDHDSTGFFVVGEEELICSSTRTKHEGKKAERCFPQINPSTGIKGRYMCHNSTTIGGSTSRGCIFVPHQHDKPGESEFCLHEHSKIGKDYERRCVCATSHCFKTTDDETEPEEDTKEEPNPTRKPELEEPDEEKCDAPGFIQVSCWTLLMCLIIIANI